MSPSLSQLASLRLNWRAYLQLVRWPLIVGLAAAYLYYAYVLPATLVEWRTAPPDKTILETVGHGLFSLPSTWSNVRVFATFAMATPVFLGFALATIIRPALQWRLTLVLPRIRSGLLACHASILAFAALVCASLARFWDATSFFATFGCAFAALSLTLPPSDPRSNRTKVGAFAKILASLVVLALAPELRDLAQQSPLLVGIGGLAIATLSFRAALPGAALREAEETPLVLPQKGLFGKTAAAQRAAQLEHWRKSRVEGRSWRHGSVGESTPGWLRVFFHERHGAIPLHRLALTSLWLSLAFLITPALVIRGLMPDLGYRDFAGMVYSVICDAEEVGGGVGYIFGIVAALGFFGMTLAAALPRISHVYVFSRLRRAQLVQAAFLTHTMVLLFAFCLGGLLVAGIAAWIANLPFDLDRSPIYLRAMIGALPCIPLWQWYGVAEITGWPLLSKALAILGLIGAISLGVVSVTPGGFSTLLPWVLPAGALSQLLFYFALRRLFLTADLTGESLASS